MKKAIILMLSLMMLSGSAMAQEKLSDEQKSRVMRPKRVRMPQEQITEKMVSDLKLDEKQAKKVTMFQNKFCVEGNLKYKYNNGFIALSDPIAAARNFINSLERIPQTIEQYKEKNASLAKDIPLLKEIANKQWKKEDELKGLKSELAALDRKIQLELAKDNEPQQQAVVNGDEVVEVSPPKETVNKGLKL